MRQAQGNLWSLPADARCITTNGIISPNGHAVMGKGCALEAKTRWPEVPIFLGMMLARHGNHVRVLLEPDEADGASLVAFPTKNHWREAADLSLIQQSCVELMALADREGWQTILLPRPGVGAGGLRWPVVREAITPLLDDRVFVVTW